MNMLKYTTGGGQALLRNKQGVKRALLYILTPLFCAALCLGTVFSFLNNKVNAAAAVKTSGAYLDLNGSGKILNAFEGAQNECVYFGTNGGSAVKWRVLDTGKNNKYGSGMLLWSDKQIAQEVYNTYYLNPEYAFWGTSYIRAILNSGTYYNAVDNETDIPKATTQINETSSWYGKLFTTDEQKAIEKTGSYTTDNYGFDSSAAQFMTKKSGITASTDEVDGQYNKNRINATSHPASKYAKVNGTSVQETTSGDKLFLLDYYDINNKTYGFGDSGVTYAEQVASSTNSSWSTSSNWFPGCYDGSGTVYNNIISDYLAFTPTSTEADYYWLRNAGRGEPWNSGALHVDSSGWVDVPGVCYLNGVRPAFNLDTTKIAYVNRNSSAVTSTFTNVSGTSSAKPEYKLYVKSTDYDTYSSNAVNTVTVDGNNLKVIYNNPASVSSGNIVVLLTEKNSTDGAVKYQAAATLSSTANASKTAVATFSLSGIDYSQYDATVLLTSANGGKNTETVYCSYAAKGNVIIPHDVENLSYDGTCKWISSLGVKPDWYDANLHNNEKVMTVSAITYKSMAEGATAEPLTALEGKKLTDLIVNAGEYNVTMQLAEGLTWSDNSTGAKSFKIVIDRISPQAQPQYEKVMKRFLKNGLPKLTNAEGGVAGEFSWGTQQPVLGTKDYTWIFIPEDTVNYTNDSGTISLTYVEANIKDIKINTDAGIYDNLTLEEIKERIVVTAVYEDDTESPLGNDAFELTAPDEPLPVGDGYTITIELPDGRFWDFTVSVTKAEMTSIRTNWIGGSTFTYPVTREEILNALRVTTTWNYAGNTAITLTDAEKLEFLTLEGEIVIGRPSLTVKYQEGENTLTAAISPTINKGTLDISGVTFNGDTLTYDKNTHKIVATGDVKCAKSGAVVSGVNFVYTYVKDGVAVDGAAENGVVNAGTYTVTLSFVHDNGNYEAVTATKSATLTVKQAKITGVAFNGDSKPEITGTTYTLEATGVPEWVTVEYYCNGALFTGASTAGNYEITARFTHDDPNYEQIAPKTATLSISDKPPVEGADDIVVQSTVTATYTGSPVDYAAKNVPAGVSVSYYIEKDGAPFSGTEIKDVGEYTITVSFDTGAAHAPIADKTCVVTISQGTYDMSGVELTGSRTVVYDGSAHGLTLTGALPDGVEYAVKYYLDGKETTPNAVGTYDVVVSFTNPDPENYKDIGDITATLTISDAAITGISAAVEGAFTTVNTLDELKAKLTVTAVYENGNTEAVSEFTLTCATLREGGLLEVDLQTVTVTYNDGTNEFTTEVVIEVAKTKVALPVYKGTLSYTGGELKPTAGDFEFNAEIVDFVDDKTTAGTNAGVYKAVFALKDTQRYEWATATTLKKALFAVVLYDLEAGEAEVEWKIARAKITATVSEGNPIPEFKSDNFRTMPVGVVGLKYYTDKDCTQEIAADALDYNTKYYVKAELLDGDNFEFDSEAESYTLSPVEYTTPEKELTFWEKVVKFLTSKQFGLFVWAWIAIAVVALIILITIIACAARSRRKKREREEQRRLEEKEERRREQEERRLEREERMARMSQPQMMMPQMMPQGMPQAGGQPMAMGGASPNEILELKAEMAAMRTEATLRAEMAAKESAEIKAVHAAEQQVANLLARLGGDQVVTNGVTLDKLTELVEKTVERVLDRREKSAVQGTAEHKADEAKEVTPVCPPDAVMTTVTTTKIDTTKKSAQPAPQAAQPAPAARTVVRNFVAPMPVDDGRVFDVGGFYNPADPVTDDIDMLDDDNK